MKYECVCQYHDGRNIALCCIASAEWQYLTAEAELPYTAVQAIIPYHNLHDKVDLLWEIVWRSDTPVTTMLHLAWRELRVVSASHKCKNVTAK